MTAMKTPIITAVVALIAAAALVSQTGCRRRPPVTSAAVAPTVCQGSSADAGTCDIVLEPYPRYDDPDALVFNDLPVQLFFFSQAPPAGTEVLRPIRARAAMPISRGDCRDTGIAGLRSLQRVAVRHKATAVVNIRATWDKQPLGDELTFGCRVVGGKYGLIWEGAAALVPAQAQADTAGDGGGDGTTDQDLGEEAGAKLRKLQNLYYQGLITREEFLERRQQILNEL
jgi:hypothetical protein